jgi:hypothetical protein
MKLLKVHWRGWYVHIIFHESPSWKVPGCVIGWSGWPRNVAATTYPSSWELWQLIVDSVIPIWLDYDDSPSLTSERQPHHLKQFCPKINYPVWGSSACRYKSFFDVVDHWALTPAAVEICMAGKTVSYVTPSTLWQISPSSLLDHRHGGYIPWPPRSPILTPMDFSFWVFVKDNVFIPPMPVDLQELCDRIFNAIILVRVTFLLKLWDELEYRLDIYRITRCSNIAHL